MLTRKENGKLCVNDLETLIFFSKLFENCKTEKEVNLLREHLIAWIENVSDKRSDEVSE